MKNKKISSISIVNTQMQLINSMEAVNYYGYNDNWLINGNIMANRNRQIESFYRSRDLSKYFSHYINLRLINSDSDVGMIINSIYARVILSILLYKEKYSCVFIGHYMNAIHRFIIRRANSYNEECRNILVDDGTGTMLFANVRKEESFKNEDLCVYTRSSKLLFAPKNKDVKVPTKLEYFSIYPIKNLLKNDIVTKNNYCIIKGWGCLSDIMIKENTMIIVGQTLVEEGILNKTQYLEYLTSAVKKAKENYHIDTFIYCPHPGESKVEEKLSSIKALLIHRNKDPFELFALTFPKGCIITGFFSSSLWNLTYLGIEASIKYIQIEEKDLLCGEPMHSHIMNIYGAYSESDQIMCL